MSKALVYFSHRFSSIGEYIFQVLFLSGSGVIDLRIALLGRVTFLACFELSHVIFVFGLSV